jgi:hypothetical protein
VSSRLDKLDRLRVLRCRRVLHRGQELRHCCGMLLLLLLLLCGDRRHRWLRRCNHRDPRHLSTSTSCELARHARDALQETEDIDALVR